MKIQVYDLEATCDDQRSILNEVIEVGAVIVENREVISEFSSFVRPVEIPILTPFCTRLTSIRQQDVQEADTFPTAMDRFATYAKDCNVLASWGWYDRKQILREAERKGYSGPILEILTNKPYRNLKIEFGTKHGIRPPGMDAALSILGIPPGGTHHRGIDDARNIAKILIQDLLPR
jgi:inhibitor of KinA sporulation pathway (predicted exonuclease)